MKKIDLHIHTSPSNYERNFIFSFDTLKDYVDYNKLDIIAITNHNHFNKQQFEMIESELECVVYPGVEVDIESSHLLVIVSNDRVEELNNACATLNLRIKSENDSITYEEFINIFPNYREYILIPHTKKDPGMKSVTLEKFGNIIKTGEVKSAKKFESTKKEINSLVPVFFSDIRIEDIFKDDDGKMDFPTKFTYVDINTTEFNVLKNALSDKEKIYLSESKKSEEFSFLPDGTTASTKLNVIIGKRSSGKTYNLNHINKSMDNKGENIKFIKQFSLTGKSEEEKFKKLVLEEQQKIINDYLEPLRIFTEKILNIDYTNMNQIDEYLISLKEFATNQSLQDSYSKTKLFNEIDYNFLDNYDTKNVINAITVLLDSEHNKDIINKHIDRKKLVNLLIELIDNRRKEYLEYKLKKETDNIVSIIREKLTSKSSMTNITPVNFYETAKEMILINEYNNIVNNLKSRMDIYNLDVYRFKLIIEKEKFKNAQSVKNALNTRTGISTIFEKEYNNPFAYIHGLEKVGISRNDIYKALISFNVKVLNEHENELSGGERAEYNLLREIKGAEHFDILLLDEPEASFDNPFIKEYIIDILKELSQKTTVFITTHNNSLGILIKPNKLIYTANEEGEFKVYTGEFGSKNLTTINNDSIISYDTIMDVMEAGKNAYEERKDIYESFKN